MKEYQDAQRRLVADEAFIEQQRTVLQGLDPSAEEVERALEPARSFHARLLDEVPWYLEAIKRVFGVQATSTGGEFTVTP